MMKEINEYLLIIYFKYQSKTLDPNFKQTAKTHAT